tara:strand:- start:127 stop:483 length:357 start_codon:yes stop_codon:yes gene_type:complete
MNILFINHCGVSTKIKNPYKNLEDIKVLDTESYKHGKYNYHVVKLKEGMPLKFKFCNTLINFSVYLIKTNKNNDKILNIDSDDIIDTQFLKLQITNYDSDDSSDIEYDICDQLKSEIC